MRYSLPSSLVQTMTATDKSTLAFFRLLRRCEIAEGATSKLYLDHLRRLFDEIPQAAKFEGRLEALEEASTSAASASAAAATTSAAAASALASSSSASSAASSAAASATAAKPRQVGLTAREIEGRGSASGRNGQADMRRRLGLDGSGKDESSGDMERHLDEERGRQDDLLKEVDDMAQAMKDTATGWSDSLKASNKNLDSTESLVGDNLSKVRRRAWMLRLMFRSLTVRHSNHSIVHTLAKNDENDDDRILTLG